jgi:hypothetical protein
MLSEHEVRRFAESQGYTLVQHNDISKVMGFKREGQRVNVYWTTGALPLALYSSRVRKKPRFFLPYP